MNVIRADDDTLFAGKNGIVKFTRKMKTKFDGSRRYATMVSIEV